MVRVFVRKEIKYCGIRKTEACWSIWENLKDGVYFSHVLFLFIHKFLELRNCCKLIRIWSTSLSVWLSCSCEEPKYCFQKMEENEKLENFCSFFKSQYFHSNIMSQENMSLIYQYCQYYLLPESYCIPCWLNREKFCWLMNKMNFEKVFLLDFIPVVKFL